jgi:hypothetical protein
MPGTIARLLLHRNARLLVDRSPGETGLEQVHLRFVPVLRAGNERHHFSDQLDDADGSLGVTRLLTAKRSLKLSLGIDGLRSFSSVSARRLGTLDLPDHAGGVEAEPGHLSGD